MVLETLQVKEIITVQIKTEFYPSSSRPLSPEKAPKKDMSSFNFGNPTFAYFWFVSYYDPYGLNPSEWFRMSCFIKKNSIFSLDFQKIRNGSRTEASDNPINSLVLAFAECDFKNRSHAVFLHPVVIDRRDSPYGSAEIPVKRCLRQLSTIKKGWNPKSVVQSKPLKKHDWV